MRRGLAGFFAISLVAFVGIKYFTQEDKKSLYHPLEAELGLASALEQEGRSAYERMRLANPITKQVPRGIRKEELAFSAAIPLQKNKRSQASSWTQLGPGNIGGRTRAMAYDEANPQRILAGGVSGGMWLSTDAGETWQKTTGPDQLQNATCLIQDTREGKTNTWYYGTGEAIGNSADTEGDGIYKSANGGETWARVESKLNNEPFSPPFTFRLAIDPTRNDSDIIVLAGFGNIYRSNDGGLSFHKVLSIGNNDARLASSEIFITPKGVYYATLGIYNDTGKKGIFRSEDGLSWEDITPANFPKGIWRVTLDFSAQNENLLYFLANTPGGGKKSVSWRGSEEWNSLWKYNHSEKGGTWQNLSDNIPTLREKDGFVFGDFMTQQGYDIVVNIKPDDSNVVFIGGTNLIRSTDGFKSSDNISWIGGYSKATDVFESFLNGLLIENHHPDQHWVDFHPENPDIMISGHDGGVSRTNDCTAPNIVWDNLNNEYFTTQFYTVAMNPSPDESREKSNCLLGGFQDNETQWIKLGSDNTNWDRISCCDGAFAGIRDLGESTYWVTSKQNGQIFLYRFDKDGKQEGIARIDPEGGSGYLFINPLIIDENEPSRLFVAGGGLLWRLNDYTKVPLEAENSALAEGYDRINPFFKTLNSRITAMASSTNPANVLYLGTSTGLVYRLEDAHLEEPTVLDRSEGLDGAGNISCIALNDQNSDELLAVFSNYERKSLYHSTDGGQTWVDVSANLEENPDGSGAGPSCTWATIVNTKDGYKIYYVATSTGLYSSYKIDGANTGWSKEASESIGNAPIRMMQYRGYDDLLVVGTHGFGSFAANVRTVASTHDQDQPDKVMSVWPNPVGDNLNVSLTANTVDGLLRLTSLDGRYTKVLATRPGASLAESYSVAELPAGTYILSLEAEGIEISSTRIMKK